MAQKSETKAAPDAAEKAKPAKTRKVVRISAYPQGGFRRCGVRHANTPTDHAIDRFTKAELDVLQAEKALNVQILDVPEAGNETKD